MLRVHPTLRRVGRRAAWYALTFAVAVTINFFLPRLGDANPIDKMMAKAGAHLDSASAKEKEEAYLREFGLAEVDAQGKRPPRRSGQAGAGITAEAVRPSTSR